MFDDLNHKQYFHARRHEPLYHNPTNLQLGLKHNKLLNTNNLNLERNTKRKPRTLKMTSMKQKWRKSWKRWRIVLLKMKISMLKM